MRPRDIFLVGVRLVGLIVAVYLVKSILSHVFNVPHITIKTVIKLVIMGFGLLGSIYAIGGAPLLVRFAFAREDEEERQQQQDNYYEPMNQ